MAMRGDGVSFKTISLARTNICIFISKAIIFNREMFTFIFCLITGI